MNRPGPERSSGSLALAALPGAVGAASSNLHQTSLVLWTVIAISAAGAIITFAILVYALRRFQDPATRRRRYG